MIHIHIFIALIPINASQVIQDKKNSIYCWIYFLTFLLSTLVKIMIVKTIKLTHVLVTNVKWEESSGKYTLSRINQSFLGKKEYQINSQCVYSVICWCHKYLCFIGMRCHFWPSINLLCTFQWKMRMSNTTGQVSSCFFDKDIKMCD